IAHRFDPEGRALLTWAAGLYVRKVATPMLAARTRKAAVKALRDSFGALQEARLQVANVFARAGADVFQLNDEVLDILAPPVLEALEDPDAVYFEHAVDHFRRAAERF